jgi:hypothetical protein
MEHTTMKRNGGWTVELATSIEGVEMLEIQPVSLDHTIRWARKEIPSVLALLAELTGVKESILRKLSGNDSDRMFVAFSFVVPQTIKKDFEQGTRPLATPPELMTDAQRYEEVDKTDPIDPRFPKVDGPVKRFKAGEDHAEKDEGGIDVGGTEVMRKVG